MSDQGPGITTEKTTKLYVPHPHAENCSIAGVLEQVAPEQPTQGRHIALVSILQSYSAYCPLLSRILLKILHGSLG